ncbi:MAG: glycosyltransferase [Proteobacteria bacterium]|nr:glycosyltransferase [Pseudomonadota bacterium]
MMRILLNYRAQNERLEEALQTLGHSVVNNLWSVQDILASQVDAIIFETKQILKREWKFSSLAWQLKKYGIPRITWCLDLPNVGASQWKLTCLKKKLWLDIFASHSLQGLNNSQVKILYLPNAAWVSRYNLRNLTWENLRDPAIYEVDVSFLGNIDEKKYPEHRARAEFLSSLGHLLGKHRITYRFLDSRFLDFDSQVNLIQKSRINLNVGCAADLAGEKSWGLPERCYGIPACGGFLLSDERRHGRADFKEGEEIVMFKDLADCLEKIKYYLAAPDERRRIAENGYKKILAQHTYIHRAATLIHAIQDWKALLCKKI